jgi:hypothetical protein
MKHRTLTIEGDSHNVLSETKISRESIVSKVRASAMAILGGSVFLTACDSGWFLGLQVRANLEIANAEELARGNFPVSQMSVNRRGKWQGLGICSFSLASYEGKDYYVSAKHCYDPNTTVENDHAVLVPVEIPKKKKIEIQPSFKPKRVNLSFEDVKHISGRSIMVAACRPNAGLKSSKCYKLTAVWAYIDGVAYLVMPEKLFAHIAVPNENGIPSLRGSSGWAVFSDSGHQIGVLSGEVLSSFAGHRLLSIAPLSDAQVMK